MINLELPKKLRAQANQAHQVAAEIFLERWRRGLPWRPSPHELVASVPERLAFDRQAVSALARRIRALGLPLALASR